MNEVKKARQQLDARNGIQPSKRKKAARKKPAPPKQNMSRGGERQDRPKPPASGASSVPQAQKKAARPAGGPAQPRPSVRAPQPGASGQAARRPSPAVDERTRAQQAIAAKRKRRRKKNYALYYIILFVFIIVAGVVLSLTVFFNIDTITVEGNSKYTSEEIVEKSGIRTGDNLFRIGTGQAVDQLVQSFVYVDKVEVNRSFPNAVSIVITEAVPVMSFSDNTGYSIVSGEGRILESGLTTPAEGTFVVNGVDLNSYKAGDFIQSDTGQGMSLLKTINGVCAELEIASVSRIDVNSVIDIRLYLDSRIRIDVGSITDLQYKLTFAKEVLEAQLGESDKGIIDVKQAGKAYFRPSENLEDYSSNTPNESNSSQSTPEPAQ